MRNDGDRIVPQSTTTEATQTQSCDLSEDKVRCHTVPYTAQWRAMKVVVVHAHIQPHNYSTYLSNLVGQTEARHKVRGERSFYPKVTSSMLLTCTGHSTDHAAQLYCRRLGLCCDLTTYPHLGGLYIPWLNKVSWAASS